MMHNQYQLYIAPQGSDSIYKQMINVMNYGSEEEQRAPRS